LSGPSSSPFLDFIGFLGFLGFRDFLAFFGFLDFLDILDMLGCFEVPLVLLLFIFGFRIPQDFRIHGSRTPVSVWIN
jgi:hypothetical protein